MRWLIQLENRNDKQIQFAIDYCKRFLSNYNIRKLDVIRINNGRNTYGAFYGRCKYPVKNKRNGYDISCQVNSNIKFPHTHDQRRSPLYFMKNGIENKDAWDIYREMEESGKYTFGAHCTDNQTKTTWVRVYESVTYYSFDECIISIFGHEIGHYLSRTKQIPYHNTEINIDLFEDKFLRDYKEYKNSKQPI